MKISNIGASLQFGKFITGKWLIFFYFSMVIILCIPISVAVIFVIRVASGLRLFSDSFVNAYAIISLLFILFFIYVFYILLKNNILKKKIKIWLEDVIELKATSSTIDTRKEYISIGAYNTKKIKVIFKINGNKVTKFSGVSDYKENKYNTKAGYDSIFRKYADREINILYSPKYDQVLILKDKI